MKFWFYCEPSIVLDNYLELRLEWQRSGQDKKSYRRMVEREFLQADFDHVFDSMKHFVRQELKREQQSSDD